MFDETALENFGNGIIIQACNDYKREYLELLRDPTHKGTSDCNMNELESFFKGDWFRFLAPGINPEYLLDRLEELAIFEEISQIAHTIYNDISRTKSRNTYLASKVLDRYKWDLNWLEMKLDDILKVIKGLPDVKEASVIYKDGNIEKFKVIVEKENEK